MAAEIKPIDELKDDHELVMDYLLDIIDAIDRRDAEKALELLILLDKLGGPHFRFEEESFYPALEKFFGREYHEYLVGVHDRVISSAKRIAEVLGKGSITPEEAAELTRLVRNNILPHPIECEGLALLAERLSPEELGKIGENIAKCREEDVPLLEWADTIRVKRA